MYCSFSITLVVLPIIYTLEKLDRAIYWLIKWSVSGIFYMVIESKNKTKVDIYSTDHSQLIDYYTCFNC